jgi:hypothetical protein
MPHYLRIFDHEIYIERQPGLGFTRERLGEHDHKLTGFGLAVYFSAPCGSDARWGNEHPERYD